MTRAPDFYITTPHRKNIKPQRKPRIRKLWYCTEPTNDNKGLRNPFKANQIMIFGFSNP
jgi:hypothetical protein